MWRLAVTFPRSGFIYTGEVKDKTMWRLAVTFPRSGFIYTSEGKDKDNVTFRWPKMKTSGFSSGLTTCTFVSVAKETVDTISESKAH